MTRQELKELGFKEIPHFTVSNSLTYQIGRWRHFSIGNLGTPNELMCICQQDRNIKNRISDAVVIHNFDFDGLLTIEKVKSFINLIK